MDGPSDGPGSSAPTAKASTSQQMETMKDTYIPIFSNRVADYREWRQRILLYKRKLALSGKEKEATINVLTSLTGVAWKQIEHLAESAVDETNGFDQVLSALDKAFKYDDRVEMPRSLEKFFYQLTRRSDQTLLAYCSEHREQMREIEKHGIKIPDSVAGWLLLRRSNLTQEQKHLVQSQVGPKLESAKVEEVMYYLFGQDYKSRVDSPSKWNKGPKKQQRWYSPRKSGTAYMTEDVEDNAYEYEIEETYVAEEAYVEEDDENFEDAAELDFEDEGQWHEAAFEEDDQQLEEAYATYLDARRQFANLKAARGYYPVVALAQDPGAPSSPPSAPSQRPFPPKGGGKSKKGSGKGKSSPSPQKGSAYNRGRAALASMQCLKCGRFGHESSACPQKSASGSPTKKAKTDYKPSQAYMVRDVCQEEKQVELLSADGWYGAQDGGASSMVCGHETLMRIIAHMQSFGVPLERYQFFATNRLFTFGGDGMKPSEWTCKMPVYVNGKSGYVECFIVEGGAPLLIGRPILKALKVKVDWENDRYSTDDENWQPAVIGPRGEFLLQLDSGVADDPLGNNIEFDLITDETYGKLKESGPVTPLPIEDYLNQTGRPHFEVGLMQQDDADDLSSNETFNPDFDDDAKTEIRRQITDKLLRNMRYYHSTMLAKRHSVMEQTLKAHEQKQVIFWEVYSGHGELSREMRRRGYNVLSFDYNTGWDFDLADHRRAFFELLDQVCPDFIWLAPDCKKWSRFQNLCTLTDEKKEALNAERDYNEAVHLKLTKKAYSKQIDENVHAGIEHPQGSEAWSTRTWHALPGYECELHQCAFGVKLADQYIKKPTRLQLSDAGMAQELALRCPGDHEHLKLEGSLPGIGSLTKAAGAYQLPFCRRVGRAIDSLFEREFAFAGEIAEDDERE